MTLVYLVILIAWLGGAGAPTRSAYRRRQNLRPWPSATADADGLPASVIVLLLGLLYAASIAIGRMSPLPDLSAYPTTAYRWSMFLMGGLTAGVVEAAAFRGYMQTGLERHNRDSAIWLTSAVFVASVLYGRLARRTGSILPGMVIHGLGDLARVYFGVLRGDAGLALRRVRERGCGSSRRRDGRQTTSHDGRLPTMAKSSSRSAILPGTLDLLILRTLLFSPVHGHGIGKHIRQTSEDVLQVEHGSLYPALQRLEREGWITSKWQTDARGREMKFYSLTPAGRKQLTQEESRWRQMVRAMSKVLRPA